MVPRPFNGESLPRSRGKKSLVAQFEIVAEAFLESFGLLEEYAPIWYTEQHHKRALNAARSLCRDPKCPEVFKRQLEEAKTEWRRRHPKAQ
jgi:hypothetical protein